MTRTRAYLACVTAVAVAAMAGSAASYGSAATANQTQATATSSMIYTKAARAAGRTPAKATVHTSTTPAGKADLTQTTARALGPSTSLGSDAIAHLIVDDFHRQVFMSVPSANEILVADFGGNITHTITNVPGANSMVLSTEGSTVFVQEAGLGAIAAVNTLNYLPTPIALPSNQCASDMSALGTNMVLSLHHCDNTAISSFGVYTPSTNTTTVSDFSTSIGDRVAGVPGSSTDVLTWTDNGWVYRWNATASPMNWESNHFYNVSGCYDMAFTPSGSQALLSCSWPNELAVINASTAAPVSEITQTDSPRASAISADGSYVALGYGSPTITVNHISGGIPGALVGTYNTGDTETVAGTMAWDAENDLFVVTHSGSVYTLRAFGAADRPTTHLSLSVPTHLGAVGVRTMSGKLAVDSGTYDGTVRTLHVSRTDPHGTVNLNDVSTTSSGSFTFTDNPSYGRVTYAVTFDGDSAYAESSGSGTGLRERPYDFNADGPADLVVGAPLETIGTSKLAGSFYVLYSSVEGPSGAGSSVFDQDTSSVPGVRESNDQFGWSQVSGDFNGDGYADLAVSSNAEDVGSVKNAGTVTVFYGSSSGVKAVGSKLIQSPFPAANGFFGEDMAVGDFNGDGRDDLAIGEAGVNDMWLTYGSSTGLSTTNLTQFVQNQSGVPGLSQGGELWGFSLSAGDINGDGRDDLAVGAPLDYDDHGFNNPNGSVTLLYGTAAGLSGTNGQRYTKDSSGVPGSSKTSTATTTDMFGYQVALGDYTGDGKADLVVSAPGTNVKTSDGVTHKSAGTLTVLYSSGTKISTTNGVEVTQSTSGMPGGPGTGDLMGETLAVGDANGDGKADLAIYSEDHYVTLVKGASGGLAYSGAVAFTQSTSSVYGTDTAGDYWGLSLRFANYKSSKYDALAVGAPGKHSAAGSVSVLYGGSSGLTGIGSSYFDQNSSGVAGSAEAGDEMGAFFSS